MISLIGSKCTGTMKRLKNVSRILQNTKRCKNIDSTKEYVRIGDVSLEVSGQGKQLDKIPHGYLEQYKESQVYLKYLKWLMQKDLLKQDTFLIGSPPGAYRRHLAMSYAELTKREIEYLCLTRDTTEADIKQRREIVNGSIVYKNQCAVNAALNGRLLIIEGIEKAERNLLPILNNLLENRELNLDDGHFLVSPDRYDKLMKVSLDKNIDLTKMNLLRVHEDFRVLAIGLPVPKYKGNPLDPPLRSRFQACLVNMVAYNDHLKELKARSAGEVNEKLIENLLGFTHSFYENEIATLGLPDFPIENLDSLIETLKHCKLVSDKQIADHSIHLNMDLIIQKLYPYKILFKPDDSNLKTYKSLSYKFDINTDESVTTEENPVSYKLHSIDNDSLVFSTIKDPKTKLKLELPAKSAIERVNKSEFILNDYHSSVLVDLCLSMVSKSDICLVGARGSGKTAIIHELANVFGYDLINTIHLYKDMNSRDLVQQRITDLNGNTKWENTTLIDACLNGNLVVLDGIHRLRDDTLLSLRRLIQDRELELLDGTKLLHHDKYDYFIQNGIELGANVKRIHPMFRIIATAELPNLKESTQNWLTSEMLSLFQFHQIEPLSLEHVKKILSKKFNKFNKKHEKLLSLIENLKASSTHDVQLSHISKQFSLRQILRLSHKIAEFEQLNLRELIENTVLYNFMPKLNKEIFNEFLNKNGLEVSKETHKPVDFMAEPIAHDGKQLTLNELVKIPDTLFYENPKHSIVLSNLYRDYMLNEHLLLIGNQGTGKNKIIDKFLMLMNKPREYIQLHRDTTVHSLTIQPNIKNGVILYEDSPLVKAVKNGHVLVIDEADKAPVHVMAILKSLIESGEMILSDGRHIVPYTFNGAENKNIIKTHQDFRIIILANRPGFPFLGNDFYSILGDLLSCHQIDNPDMESEIEMLRKYAPNINVSILNKLVNAFNSLRNLTDQGLLSYPYSTREIVNIVKHLQKFPNDNLSQIIRNIYDFDHFTEQNDTKNTFKDVMSKHGIPIDMANTRYTVSLAQKQALPAVLKLKSNLNCEKIFNPFTGQSQMSLNWKAIDKFEFKTKACEVFEERVDTFHELYRTWTTPFKSDNLVNDMCLSTNGQYSFISCLKPISIARLDLTTNKIKAVQLDTLFQYAWRSYYPRLKIQTTLENGIVLVHDEITNNLFKIDFETEHIEKANHQFLITETKRKFFIDETNSFKITPLNRDDGLFVTYRQATKKVELIDLKHNRQLSLGFGFTIKNLTQIGRNKLLVNGFYDGTRMDLVNYVFEYSNTHGFDETCCSLFKIDGLLDYTNDAFYTDLQLHNVDKFKMPDLLKDTFGSAVTEVPSLIPTLNNHFVAIINGNNEEYMCKRQSQIRNFTNQLINLKSIVDFSTNTILTQIPLPPVQTKLRTSDRDEETASTKANNLGSVEICDLTDRSVSYLQIPKSINQSAMDDLNDSYYESTFSSVNDANFLMDMRNSNGNLMTLDFNGYLREWEISKLNLERSLDEWFKLVSTKQESELNIEILKSQASEDSLKDLNGPKHGKVDPKNAPHVGGNTWAGGSGGRDTAGMGGVGGPYRLDSGNPVYQVSDEVKQNVPEHVRKAAREMGQKAFRQRLNEIKMSVYEHDLYQKYLENVKLPIKQLKNILDGLEAKKKERQWLKHQLGGDLDDTKLIEAIIGDKNVFKKRGEDKNALNDLQIEKPKRVKILVDVSGSMYRFNGMDKRLERQLETVLMVMEAFKGYENKVRYDIVGHSGDGYDFKFSDPMKPPENEAERLKLLQTLVAHSQFCSSGDYTLEATKYSIEQIAKEDADEHFVIVLSDANFDRYGISPRTYARVMNETNKNVNVFCVFIGSLGGQADVLKRSLPFGKAFICMNTKDLPNIMQQIFQSSLLK